MAYDFLKSASGASAAAAVALALATVPAAAQAEPASHSQAMESAPVPDSTPVPKGVEVERVELAPGDSVVFAFAPGKVHQLLKMKAQGEAAMAHKLGADEVRATVKTDSGMPKLVVENGTDNDMTFTMLTDFDGDGGFVGEHSMTVNAKGSVTHPYEKTIAMVNIGNFDPS